MSTVHFILYDIKCNDFDSHTLRNGVLNTINPYYDGFQYTLCRKLEKTTFNLYYMFLPRKLITSDLLHQLNCMKLKFKFVDKNNG
jgi:hypothetical protein